MTYFKNGLWLFCASFLFAIAGCTDSETDNKVINQDGVITNSDIGIWQDKDVTPVEFNLVKTIDLSGIEEPVISSIGYLTMDENDNFYFFDRNVMKLISLNSEGELRWAVGQEGKGPGDFENPFGMAIHEGMLYIVNIQGTRIDEFDLDGNFIRSLDVPSEVRFASLVGFREDGLMLMSGAKFGTVGTDIYTLKMSTDSLNIVNSFGIIETDDEKYQRATTRGSVGMLEDSFFYTFSTDYKFNIYDYEGELKMEVSRKFDGALGPGVYAQGGSVSMYSLGSIGSPVFLDNGNYLINVSYPANIDDPNEYARKASTGGADSPEYVEFMDLYSADHQLLYTFDDSEFVEGLGSLRTRDYNGYFYSSFSSDLLIKKYEVKAFKVEME